MDRASISVFVSIMALAVVAHADEATARTFTSFLLHFCYLSLFWSFTGEIPIAYGRYTSTSIRPESTGFGLRAADTETTSG